MHESAPQIIVLAGPNGAGKSTSAPHLLRGTMGIHEFVNADVIAQGLSGFSPDAAAFEAAGIMLVRLRKLAGMRKNFAFETTLASRSLAPWISELRRTGYIFRLMYLWLPDADYALARVTERVRRGGHDVPEETIRRRYAAGLRNFFRLYQPIADSWLLLDNTVGTDPRPIAAGCGTMELTAFNMEKWELIRTRWANG